MADVRPTITINRLDFQWTGSDYSLKYGGFEISAYRPTKISTEWVWEICTTESRDEVHNVLEAASHFDTAREALKDACDFVSRFAPVATELAERIKRS